MCLDITLRGITLPAAVPPPTAGTPNCQPPHQEFVSWPLAERTQDVSVSEAGTRVCVPLPGSNLMLPRGDSECEHASPS